MDCHRLFDYQNLEGYSSDPFAFASPPFSSSSSSSSSPSTFCLNNQFLFIVSLTWICLLFVTIVVVTGILVRLLIMKGLKYEARKRKEREWEVERPDTTTVRGDNEDDEIEEDSYPGNLGEKEPVEALDSEYEADGSDLETGKRMRRNRQSMSRERAGGVGEGNRSRSRSRSRGRTDDEDAIPIPPMMTRPRSNTFNSTRSAVASSPEKPLPGSKGCPLKGTQRKWSWRWNAACSMVLFGNLVLLGLLFLELGHFFAVRGVLKVVSQGLPMGLLITGVTYVMMRWYEVIIGQVGRYKPTQAAPSAAAGTTPSTSAAQGKKQPPVTITAAVGKMILNNNGKHHGGGYHLGVNPSTSSLSSSGLSIFSRPSSPVPTAPGLSTVNEVYVDIPLTPVGQPKPQAPAAPAPTKTKLKDRKKLRKVLLMWFLGFNAVFHLFFWPPWIASGVLEARADAMGNSHQNGTAPELEGDVELRNLLVGCSLIWVGVCGLVVSFFIAALAKKLIGMLEETNQLTGSKKIHQIVQKVFRYSGIQGMIWLSGGAGFVGLGIWGVVNRAEGVKYFYYLMNFWLVPSMFLGGLLLVYAGVNGKEKKKAHKKGDNLKENAQTTPNNGTATAASPIPPTTTTGGNGTPKGEKRNEDSKKWLLTRSPSLSSISSAATTTTSLTTMTTTTTTNTSGSSSRSPLSPVSSISSPYPLSATSSAPGGMPSPLGSPTPSPFSPSPSFGMMRKKLNKPTDPLPSIPGSSETKDDMDGSLEAPLETYHAPNIAMLTLIGAGKKRRQRSLSNGILSGSGSPLARDRSGNIGPSVIVERVDDDDDKELHETV